jgi:hypothetical protein
MPRPPRRSQKSSKDKLRSDASGHAQDRGPYKAASRSDPRPLRLRPLYGWSVVTTSDVVAFVADQGRGSLKVAAIADGGSGLSTRKVALRLSSLWGFYACLVAGGDAAVRSNPVPWGLATRGPDGRGVGERC